VPNGGRDGNARTDPHVAPRELYQMYLYPFRRVIQEAHPLGVMSSYNDWDGEPVSASYFFLTELLRKAFGFNGYVVSDSDAVEFIFNKHHVASDNKDGVRQAVEAGLNVRTNFDDPSNYITPVRELIKEKKLSVKTVDASVSDVLRVKFKLGLFDHPYVNPVAADSVVFNDDAKIFSKQISREALVLLKNKNNLLPLNKTSIKNILVTGPLAADTLHSMSRYGPNNIKVVSVLNGIKKYVGSEVNVMYSKGCETIDSLWPESEIFPQTFSSKEKESIDATVEQAKSADVVIAVLGEDESLVGESRSRTSLDLPGKQLQLLQALYETGKPIVLVLINGRPLTINWPNKFIPSIIEAWFPGLDGGNAIAETIFGDYNPGGKLSMTFPKSVGQIEYNFPFKPGAHAGQPGDGPNGFGKTNVYGSLYPFGYGLSYTSFGYSNLMVTPEKQKSDKEVNISVDITNTGKYKGDEVVQLYFKDETSSVTVYESQLRGFERVSLNPGETKTINFTLRPDDLKLLDKKMKWVVEPGTFEVLIGSSSEDIRLRKKFIIE
jgi:beta-glucosidase